MREKVKKLDLLGALLLTASLVALFFSLQWGGAKYSWSDPRVYACIVISGIFTIAFIVLQTIKKEE